MLMNKIYILTLLLPACLHAEADPIDLQQAQRIASQSLGGEAELVAPASGARHLNGAVKSAPAYYIFNRTEGKGFVIVSGDDAYPDILGYGDRTVTDATELPAALSHSLQLFTEAVEQVRAGLLYASASTSVTYPTTPVLPMLTSSWDQSKPYNYYCPVDNGKRTVTGCVATAMAQVMNYWQWPAQGQGTREYQGQKIDYSKSTYQWDLMKYTYGPTDDGTDAGNAVAKVMYDCGTSVAMKYSADGSGTSLTPVSRALVQNFKYRGSTIEFTYQEEFDKPTDWSAAIYGELHAGRPVIAAGASVSGSGRDAGGHCYVFDGCDARGYVHVNWGWSGNYDGFYSLDLLNPQKYSFIDSQQMVWGIQPDRTGTDSEWEGAKLYVEDPLTTSYKTVRKGAIFTVSVDKLYNINEWSMTFVPGIGLYDKQGNLVENVTYNKTLTRTLASYTYLVNPTFTGRVQNTYPDGDYTLRVIGLDQATGNWLQAQRSGGLSKCALAMKCENGVFYPGQVTVGIDGVDGGEAAAAASVRYFDLSGREISGPVSGQPYIERQILTDGTVQSVKRIAR